MSVMPNSDHSPQSSFSEDLSDSLGDNNQGDELIRLQGLLADERARNKCLEKELEDTKGRIMELNRRYQDATRAYEQERTVRFCILSVCMPACLSVCLSVCLPACLSVCINCTF